MKALNHLFFLKKNRYKLVCQEISLLSSVLFCKEQILIFFWIKRDNKHVTVLYIEWKKHINKSYCWQVEKLLKMCLLKNIAADTSQRAFPSFYEVVSYKSQDLYRKIG